MSSLLSKIKLDRLYTHEKIWIFFLFLFRLNSVEKLKIYVSRSRQGTHNNNNDNNNIMVVFKCLSLKALSALQDHEGGRGIG